MKNNKNATRKVTFKKTIFYIANQILLILNKHLCFGYPPVFIEILRYPEVISKSDISNSYTFASLLTPLALSGEENEMYNFLYFEKSKALVELIYEVLQSFLLKEVEEASTL